MPPGGGHQVGRSRRKREEPALWSDPQPDPPTPSNWFHRADRRGDASTPPCAGERVKPL